MIAKKLLTTIAFAFVLLFSGCAEDDFNQVDGLCPVVESTVPEDGDFDMPLNQVITATFNEKMNPSTITEASFTVSANGALIDGTVSYNGLTATFLPDLALEPDTEYTGTITTMAKDERGNALQENYVWSFTTLPEYLVVVSSNPTIGGITTGGDLFLKGTPVTVTAAPNALYTFTNWTDNGVEVSTSANYTFVLMGDRTLVANYTIIPPTQFAVNTSAFPVAGGSTTGSGPYDEGTLVPVTATANPEYNFVNWTVGGVQVSVNPNYSFVLTANTNLVANFVLKTYTLTVLVVGNGTVAKNPLQGPYDSGSTVTLTPTAADGFVFTGWSVDASGNNNPLSVLMNGNKNITATFTAVIPQFTITLNSDTNQGTTLGAGTFDAGSTKTVEAIAKSGYTFSNWTENGVIVPLAGANYQFVLLKDRDLTANFTLTGSATGPGIIDLGTAGDFVILSKSGIDRVGVTSITGNIGVSPIDQTAITGFSQIMDVTNTFSTSSYVNGKIYAADYTAPTPAYLTTAVSDMETAFITANGLTTNVIVALGAGDISGMTLAPGLYKWDTGLLITNEGVTLSGGPDDTWVFQISDDFTINNDAIITLAGGAQAKNIFWVTSTQALLGSNVQFKGNILAQTLISVNTGTSVIGKLLSQTAVTLNAATVVDQN